MLLSWIFHLWTAVLLLNYSAAFPNTRKKHLENTFSELFYDVFHFRKS